jgi:1,4-alpha-glucan branching enzyme
MSRSRRKSNGSQRSSSEKTVEIAIENLEARDVCITGSFSSWDPLGQPLKRNSHGVWHTKLHLLPGRYEYRLLTDGTWCDDPQCKERVPNPFGSVNCVLSVA